MRRSNPVSQPVLRICLAIAAAVLLLAFTAESQESKSAEASSPVEAPVRTVQTDVTTVARTYAGRTSGARKVDIRARVGGIVESRAYKEGDFVETGDVLFRIDPRRYEVQVQRAEAELARAEAEERQAEREWNRVSELFEDDAISERERDEVRSMLELARAGLALAEADVAEARIDLDYTAVEASVSGIAGLEEHPEGSLVDPGALLTTVTQLDPIQVRFSIPEAHVNTFGPQIRGRTNIQLSLTLPNGDRYSEAGELDFTESAVDSATGTVRARAVFPNPNQQLVPGQFVRVTLSGLFMGLLIQIPQEAVAQDSDGPYVYVLDDEDRAQRRSVKLGPNLGNEVVIADGLSNGDRVIVAPMADLEDNASISPQKESELQEEDLKAEERDRMSQEAERASELAADEADRASEEADRAARKAEQAADEADRAAENADDIAEATDRVEAAQESLASEDDREAETDREANGGDDTSDDDQPAEEADEDGDEEASNDDKDDEEDAN
ncbi:MAG: efflux RND transporter periplasmic adaptor subunit [Aquisalimonadaceae bacterium]